jgi:S-disulfanyl-L-cysteine oxidoreductase SoxD
VLRVVITVGVVCLAAAVAGQAAQENRRTIWDGVYSAAQAGRGERGYAQSCATCHAEDLLGTTNAPPLVGEPFLGRFDRQTADDVVLTVRQTMPQEAPNSLGLDAYVDIVAYLFKANGSPAGSADLPADRAMLKQVLVTAREVR